MAEGEPATAYDAVHVSITMTGQSLVGPRHVVAARIAEALEDAKAHLYAEYARRNRHGR